LDEAKSHIKSLLKAIFRNYKDPILVLDSGNYVIEYNESAASLLKINKDNQSLNDLLLEESGNKLNELIQASIKNKSYITYEDFVLKLKDNSEVLTNLNLNYINFENDFFVLVSLLGEDPDSSILNFTKIDIRSGNPVESILNPQLRKVLKEIKNLYPFTLTGKDRLRKLIDDFDEAIRIKTNTGKFILVNQSYAQSLGISVTQLEGRNETDFIPQFVKDFLLSIDRYLYETHNYIIIEGIPLQGIFDASEQQVIQIPIQDYENNVIAVVSITQSKTRYADKGISAELYLSGEVIEIFPKPVAYLDKYSQFQHVSEDFCKLLTIESESLSGIHISEVLPSELTESIKNFQNSNISVKEFFTTEDMIPCSSEESKFKIFLHKISLHDLSADGVFIFIDEAKSQVDLNQLIKQRGRMFDILVQKNPEPIFIYDIENLRFLEVNEAAVQLYGYSHDEFLQMDLTDLYTPEDIQTLLGSSSEDSDINAFAGPYRHKKKNGESVFVEISKTKFRFNEKDCFFNIVKNVSAQLELEKKNQLFKAAFDNTSDIIIITDSNGFINFINKSGTELLGYSEQEIQSTSFAAIVKDEDRAMINTSVFNSEIKETASLLLDIKKANGNYIYSEISFTPVFDFSGKVESFTVLLKHKTESLSESKTEVKEIIKEIIVEKTDKIDSEMPDPNFLSGVFHEILTPMNVILGFTQELTDSISNPTSEQKEASELINQNKLKLLGTMNSVVEYSELLQHKSEFRYSEISITDLIEKLDKKITEFINVPDTQFSYGKISSSLTFITNSQKFELLISSLVKIVGKIIKEKKLYFSAFPQDEERFIVLVSDNYNNCSDYLVSKLKLIFTGNNDLRDIGAPRLTTHLAKILLPILGGSFIVNENIGSGFLFPLNASKTSDQKKFESADEKIEQYLNSEKTLQPSIEVLPEPEELKIPDEKVESESLTEDSGEKEIQTVNEYLSTQESDQQIDELPVEDVIDDDTVELVEPEPEPEPELSEVDQKVTGKQGTKLDLTNLSCLYIEDQVDSQILFKVQMKGLKEIKFAVSFEEALPMLESRTFDFIVMDINLQGEYNGLDALKIINKMPAHENTPIIAVTAYVLPGDKEKFISTGFNDFVSKPIFREKMIESLERVFSN
jgi:PAS domain S-box-containing protein